MASEGSEQGGNDVASYVGPDLDVVFAFYAEAADVLPVPAHADGEPGGASIRAGACPLPRRDRIDGRVIPTPGGQIGEFGDQYAADHVLGPMGAGESFDQVTVG